MARDEEHFRAVLRYVEGKAGEQGDVVKRPMRVYADTSVFGGALDPEFSPLSETFFARVRAHAVELVVSSVVLDELEGAPESVRRCITQ